MGLMKKLTSAVVASSLVLGLVSSAFAAPSTEQINDAFARLSAYNVVQGKAMADGTVSPALGDTLTRAELVTILARAFGQEETAKLLKGATSFSDVAANEWYSGYVALIKNIAESKKTAVGYEDGTFRPNQNVKAIEALAFIMKLLGVQPGTGANWAADTIAAAKDAGIITAADAEAYLAAPTADATRGLAFGLADAIFRTYQVSAGKTVYTTYVDNVKPVLTINKPAEPTTTKTAYTVTGKAEGATAVYFGSEKITANADGSFTVDVSLAMGANTITFSAVDMAGNITEESFSLTRNAGAAEKVAASLSATSVMAGATADLTYTITDANGTVLTVNADDVTVVVAGEIGSFDKAAGKLTAATKVATGTITVSYGTLTPATINVEVVAGALTTVVADSGSAAPGAAVKLVAKDAYGNVISGATFSETSADAFIEGGNFVATKAGQYTVTATKDGVSKDGVIGVFGEHAAFKIEAPAMVANGATEYTVTVTAVDEAGNKIASFDDDVTLDTDLTVALATVAAVDGVAKFTVTVPVGMENVDADITATLGEVTSTAAFTIAAQVATSIDLTADEYLAINDAAFSGGVKVLDQAGEPMQDGDSFAVKLVISGPAYFAGGTDKEDTISASGTALPYEIVPVNVNSDGTVTITATAEGLTSASKTVKAVYAFAPKNLVVTAVSEEAAEAADEGAYEFKITLTDKNGVPVKADGAIAVELLFDNADADDELTVSYKVDGGTSTGVGLDEKKTTVSFADGNKEIVVSVKAGELIGKVNVTAKADDLTTASGSVEFVPGDLAQIAYEKDTLNVLSSTDYTLSIQLQDGAGNAIAKSGVKVQFSATPEEYTKLNGAFKAYTTTTDANGKASVPVNVLPYGTNFTITATLDSNDDGTYDELTEETADASLTIVPSVAKSISVTSYLVEGASTSQATSFEAGKKVQIRAVVTDNNGLKWAGEDFETRLALSGIEVEDIYESALPAFDWDPILKVYTAEFTPEKAGSYALSVADETSATKVSGPRSISVKAGAPYTVKFLDEDIKFTVGEVKELVAYVVDEYDNKVAASKVSKDMVFTVTLANKATTAEAGYYLVRKTAEGGGTGAAEFTISKFTTSVKVFFVTDDEDTALLSIDVTAPAETEGSNPIDLSGNDPGPVEVTKE